MKKYILIIILLVIIAFQFNDIKNISIINNDNSEVFSGEIILIGKKELLNDDKTDYQIEINYRYLQNKNFDLFVNLDDESIYFVNDKNKIYSFDEYTSKEILSCDIFSKLYKYSKPPKEDFKINNESVQIELDSFSWNYKLLNEEYRNNNLSILNFEYNIELPKDSFMELKFDIVPDEIEVKTSLNDKYILEDECLYFKNTEENVFYHITVKWDNELYFGQKTYSINVKINLPFEVILINEEIYAGDLLMIEIKHVDKENVNIDQPFVSNAKVWENNFDCIALIPINYWTESGNYEITITSDKTNEVIVIPIIIKKKDFSVQYLYIDKKIEQETKNEESYEEYALYMNPAREISRDVKYFDGLFIQPVEGRISTEYGMYRYVNDSMTSYRHSGIDIAIDEGTPVKAANSGYVNLSRFLTLTGNTVVIDHGLGIFSVYFHMNSLGVEKDQFVSKGDVIGTVGSTGFSTGPHLHWTMSYYKMNLNPYFFIEKNIGN